jgi:hypothetical protein
VTLIAHPHARNELRRAVFAGFGQFDRCGSHGSVCAVGLCNFTSAVILTLEGTDYRRGPRSCGHLPSDANADEQNEKSDNC